MARSPWRDAVDGQLRCLRILYDATSIAHFGGYFMMHPAIVSLSRIQAHRVLLGVGEVYRNIQLDILTQAQPIYLTSEMTDATLTHQGKNNLRTTLHLDRMPVRNGFVWFPGTIWVDEKLREGFGVEQVPRATGAGLRVVALHFFVPSYGVTVTPSLTDPGGYSYTRIDHSKPTLGVTAYTYIDANSTYPEMYKETGAHIAPLITVGIMDGDDIESYMLHMMKIDPERDDMALHVWVYSFLYSLFTMMNQRITRWGTVPLTPKEQDQTQRHGMRPEVQLVTWRKAEYHYPEGHIPVPKNWSCRWEVSEHPRTYKSGKTIMVKSYKKGPKDKPMRPKPTFTVHAVTR